MVGKRRLNATCFLSTAWTADTRGEMSILNGNEYKVLEMNGKCGEQNLNVSAHVSTLDKVRRGGAGLGWSS